MATFARAFVLVVCGIAACSSPPQVVPTRNFDRPSDMTFLCLEVHGRDTKEPKASGRPMASCQPTEAPRTFDPKLPRNFGTFAVVTNSARGELGVIDLERGRLIDLDPDNFGYNFLPVGQLPEAIAASSDGCLVVSANRGSCDLTLVDPARLLASTIDATPSTGTGSPFQTLVPRTRSGRLRSAPAEVVFLPEPTKDLEGAVGLCARDGAAIVASDMTITRRPWRALVTFPSCDLVALIELPSGQIVSSVRIGPNGASLAGDDPICPIDCGAGVTPLAERPALGPVTTDAAVDATADAVPGDVGVAVPVPLSARRQLGVAPLALVPDGSRVYVGATAAPFVIALDVSREGLAIPGSDGVIPLHEGAVGTSRLRLSVDPYTAPSDGVRKGEPGRFVGAEKEFLYAFARDGSVRVVDVLRRARGEIQERECDANIDPVALASNLRPDKVACYPVSDDPAKRPQRKPLALGPGLRVPVGDQQDLPLPLPKDIAFANLSLPGTNKVSNNQLDGAFGFLLATDGEVYVMNLDPTNNDSSTPPFVHSFRNAALSRAGTKSEGPEASDPVRDFTTTEVPFPIRIGAVSSLRGPLLDRLRIKPPTEEGPPDKGLWVVVPPGAQPRPQRWSVVWEGALPGTARATGVLRPPGATVGAAGALDDQGANFCRSAVERGDELMMVGCDQDIDCQRDKPGVHSCYPIGPGTPGICLPTEKLRDEAFLRGCARIFTSRRRYEITRAGRSRLELGLKIDEVPRPATAPCANDTDCQPDAAHRGIPGRPETGYRCLPVGTARRCVRTCNVGKADRDRDCRAGTVCEEVVGFAPGGLCVEAPPLDPACFGGDVRFRVQAGNSFLVTGSSTTGFTTTREDNGECRPDLTRHPLLSNRIRLDSPFCKGIDAMTKPADIVAVVPSAADASGWGNACLFYAPNQDDPTGVHLKAYFANPEIRFVVTNLEEYVGDAASIRFVLTGGFVPETVSARNVFVGMPERIVTGPVKLAPFGSARTVWPYPYLFVVDQGRISNNGGRGQILRITPRLPTGSNAGAVGQFDSIFSSSTFPIQ